MKEKPNNIEEYLKDYGPKQVELPIRQLALFNDNYRVSIWTGNYLQVTVMSINPNDDIGLEIHDNIDQLLFVVSGQASVYSGSTKDTLSFKNKVEAGDLITIPAKTWHNVKNIGKTPLKLCSVYAPIQHPYNTKQKTKADDKD